MTSIQKDIILLSHGGGGQKTGQLINDLILSTFDNPILNKLDDAASFELSSSKLVMSTDSYVVSPLFFPDANIGTLAACGTINDLTMQGALPVYLSLSLIIEEGFEINQLKIILKSIASIIEPLNIKIITGDTKVVEHGNCNGLFINTTGLGIQLAGINVQSSNAKAGDKIILSGTMGDHGMAIMCQREGLKMVSPLKSDVAALMPMILPLLETIPDISVLRDPTRGGVAAALNDIAGASNHGIRLIEKSLPVKPEVNGASSLLGLDPLTIANEGKALIFCPADKETLALKTLKQHPLGSNAVTIGSVVQEHPGKVVLETILGGERIVDTPSGESLPRIC